MGWNINIFMRFHRDCLVVFLYLALSNFAFGQILPEQDCISAIPVCQNTYVQNTPYSGQGLNGNEINGSKSCLFTGEKNDVWYTFTVQTSGNLCFSIIPDTLTKDYDWAVFNLSVSPCDSIFYDGSLEVACNFSNVPGVTGANGLAGSQNESCIPVNSGETYVVNVSKFSASASGYTLDFSASTAQLFDNIPPEMDSVVVPVFCGDSQLFIFFSENVICSTVKPSGFVLTGPSGTIPVANVSSAGCTSGSTYDNDYVLTVSSPLAPTGNYSLILLANAGVEDLCNNANIKADTVVFSVSPYSMNISSTPQLCSNNNGTITSVPGGGISPYTFSWNTPVPQNSSTATGLTPGAYTVTVTDAIGCVSNGSGIVGFDPGANPPVAQISSSTNATCSGLNNGTATVSVTGGTQPYVFLWNTNPVQVTSTASGLATGTAICTVTDNNGCFDTASVNISGGVPIFISATPQDTFICNGGTATLSASVAGGTNPFSFTWLKNGIPEGVNIPFNVSPTATTVYSVFATDVSGCKSDTDDVNVNVFPPVLVNILPVNGVCVGDSVKLTANASGGKGSGYVFIWDKTTETGSQIYVFPNANTTYTVTVTDGCTNEPGISSVDVVVGQPPPQMHIKGGPLEGCVPLEIEFYVESFFSGYIYMWDFGDGNLKNTTLDTVSHTYLKEGCKDVSLIIITNEGCRDTLVDSCLITPWPSPEANFTYLPASPTTLNPIVTFSERSSGASSWQWNLGDFTISRDQIVQHEYADSGNYQVKLVVFNEFNCPDTAESNVRVEFETTVYLPNTFSPDGDGLNDLFMPQFEGVKREGFNLYIFNRWGGLVYQTDNFNNPWDGKTNGNPAKDGVYLYLIKYKNFNGEDKKIRGSVTLLK